MNEKMPHSGISKIEVDYLFGRYDYVIDLGGKEARSEDRRKISLLYGDNGSGKTTILSILWHLLSATANKGHRTALANSPFKAIRVTLISGDEIRVIKENIAPSSFIVSVYRAGQELLEVSYQVDARGRVPSRSNSAESVTSKISRLTSEELARLSPREISLMVDDETDDYVSYLEEINISPHFLADDRRIHGDDIEDPVPEAEVLAELRRNRRPQGSSLTSELDNAIKRVNELFRQMVIAGNASGSRNTDNVYLDLLRRVANAGSSPTAKDEIRQNLESRIYDLANRTALFNEFGLASPLDAVTFSHVLERIPIDRLEIAEDVLVPYLDAQDARLNALGEAEALIRTLVRQVNSFFTDKEVRFSVRDGIEIDAGGVPLPPSKLSSGERQILLLLLNTIQARHGTRLFLIDEPEISLNVKWQRKLIDALLACAEKSSVQFVIASHSIEMITGNTDRLARLKDLGGN
ncbi:AAA family ATPase [Streptomyces canus]|uniref:AAA family ATPase n=1 Tax=Streptomyces canus TaxID=58343 RepID=UPI0030E34FA5